MNKVIFVLHRSEGITLEEFLREWSSERHAVHAVLPPYGRAVPAKVRAFLEHFERSGAL